MKRSRLLLLLCFLALAACKNAVPRVTSFQSNQPEDTSPKASGKNPINAPNVLAGAEKKTVGGSSYSVQVRAKEMGINETKTVSGSVYSFAGKVVVK